MDKFFSRRSPKGSPVKRSRHDDAKDRNGESPEKSDEDSSLNPRHVTRGVLIEIEKDKYLNMPLSEKRKYYKCKNKYLTLEDVQTWPEYAEENDIQSARKTVFDCNPEINDKVSIWRGDITRLEIDAIANAANSSLLGGGGVDGAIHSAAGSGLRNETATLGGCECGDAKISGGYKLPARYIIHTVGPMGKIEERLRSCYSRCLKIMKDNNLRSLALPCVSTGIYGYPNEDAAFVALETIRKFLEKYHKEVDRIIFCLFLEKDVNIYNDLMPQYFPVESEKESAD